MSQNMHEILERHFKELRRLPNVLNASVGTKRVNGVDTGRPSIVVYVAEKKPLASLAPAEVIPTRVEDVEVDVVELSTKDYVLGETSPSRLPPKAQKRMAGGVRK